MSLEKEIIELLYTISSAANKAISLDDFLNTIIDVIVAEFNSDIGLIYLLEKNELNLDVKKMKLVSSYGEFGESSNSADYLSTSIQLIQSTIDDIKIRDTKSEQNINIVWEKDDKFIITALLFIDEKILGILILARKKNTPYGNDEVSRNKLVATELAKIIYYKQNNELVIALSERQRLLRDLHDSVSQKLYGLVALTEAAQAGIEAGSDISPEKVLARIGENARQAVKEMRLFLYEMQPRDLEKDGLVKVLHYRLSAVEGRADIKARFIADSNIVLSKEKQIGLYYIAQEALNNVLRHARAKSVAVSIKQNKSNVILEIADDGDGFKLEDVHGGMGLQIMKERAIQIGGKLKISSKLGLGTKVLVTLKRDM